MMKRMTTTIGEACLLYHYALQFQLLLWVGSLAFYLIPEFTAYTLRVGLDCVVHGGYFKSFVGKLAVVGGSCQVKCMTG